MRVVYADIVLAINFFMNLSVLWGAGQLLGRRCRRLGLFLGALLMAGAHVVLMLFAPNTLLINLVASLVMICLGVFLAFYPKSILEWLRLTGMCYVVAFALGGLGMAMFYFTNVGIALQPAIPASFSLNILLASAAAFYIAIRMISSLFAGLGLRRQMVYEVSIFVGDKGARFRALLDTGNTLKDPFSNAPIIVAEFSAVKHSLPEALRELFGREDCIKYLADIEPGEARRIRLIPFTALGTNKGILPGFRCDRVEIRYADDAPTTLYEVVVGVYNNKLSKGSYQGLLNPEILA